MQAFDFFSLLPAMIWWLIGVSFLVLWRIKIATWHCGIGFALTGTGFALDAYPIWGSVNPFLSGLCYIAAALLYSACVLHHFEVKTRSLVRLIMPLSYVALHTYFNFGMQGLRADLLITDVVFAFLFLHALLLTKSKVSGAADIFFLISGGLVSADCLVRSVLFNLVFSSTDQLAEFANSNYSIAVQCTTVTIGLLFPFSVVAAMTVRAIARHRDAADIDPMTGVLNRRGFFRLVSSSRANGSRTGALLVADIDYFKRVNDAFGHKAGDTVIQGLADVLLQRLEPTAIVARFGGEEFVAYLPGRTAADALGLANVVNHEFGARDWRAERIHSAITVSIGVTQVEAFESEVDAAIDRADKALYVAKDAGRNRAVVNTEQSIPLATGADKGPDASVLIASRSAA